MKQILVIIILYIFFTDVQAQNNNIPDSTGYYYCSLAASPKNAREGYTISINFGGEENTFMKDPRYAFLLPEGNKPATLRDPFVALNKLGKLGWRLVLHSSTTFPGYENYILEKKR
jgi:hypothetical protein